MVRRAIQMNWDWGFLWKNIRVYNSGIGIDIKGQGAGSQTTSVSKLDPRTFKVIIPTFVAKISQTITVLDSYFSNVDRVLNINPGNDYLPEVVLDNLKIQGSTSVIVGVLGGETFLPGGQTTVKSWAMGKRYLTASNGTDVRGNLPSNSKPRSLLDRNGAFVEHKKPQYDDVPFEEILNVLDYGVKNDGTGDNTWAISKVLALGIHKSKVVFFPAGIYTIEDTLHIPVGSRIIGELWSQIMAVGEAFEDKDSPTVVIR